MSAEILASYLVSLGFETNAPEFRKFQTALSDARRAVAGSTSGIVQQLLTWQGAITGAFVGISGAVIGLADHVAQSDLRFQLLGTKMMLRSADAKKLQMALDELGVSLEEVAWNPELRSRFQELIADQDKWQKSLGPNFEKNMVAIRDIRMEVNRLDLAFKYLTQRFVSSLIEKLGGQSALDKLQDWFQWLIDNGPAMADKLADNVIPILKGTWKILTELGEAVKEFGVLFANVIGLLSGDTSLQGAEFSFDRLAGSIQHVVGWMADFVHAMTDAERFLARLATAASLFIQGDFSGAAKEMRAALGNLTAGSGAVIGAGVGTFFGPEGTAIGAGAGALIGEANQLLLGGGKGENTDIRKQVIQGAQRAGVDPALALSVAKIESGLRQYGKNGDIVRSGVGAMGVMQLMPGTAKTLGVDPTDANQNIEGGTRYLGQLMSKYKDARLALEAYNWGPGNLDKAMRNHTSVPASVYQYASSAMAGAQQVSIGSVNVHVNEPNATPQQVQHATQRGIQDAFQKQNQLAIAQFNPAF